MPHSKQKKMSFYALVRVFFMILPFYLLHRYPAVVWRHTRLLSEALHRYTMLCSRFAFARCFMRMVYVCLLVACCYGGMLWHGVAWVQASPASKEEIRSAIKNEQAKAQERRKSLSRLSAKERMLNANLARAEDSIDSLELRIAKQGKELKQVEHTVREVRDSLENLEKKYVNTQKSLDDLLLQLWPLHVHQYGVGKKDGSNWAQVERDYRWTQHLYYGVEERSARLRQQEKEIVAALEKQESLMKDVKRRVAIINANKEELLKKRLAFRQQLTSVRREKKNAEEELRDVLSIIQRFNVRLEQMEGKDISKMKGYLPWPASGRVIQRYSPKAKPPVRGLGFALANNAPVKAVAWGKVAHNGILRGMGRVVILMHDKAYYSVYAFLGNSSLNVGQTVKSGTIIGTAGFYPEAKGNGLYFELRFHQKAINPESWLVKAS